MALRRAACDTYCLSTACRQASPLLASDCLRCDTSCSTVCIVLFSKITNISADYQIKVESAERRGESERGTGGEVRGTSGWEKVRDKRGEGMLDEERDVPIYDTNSYPCLIYSYLSTFVAYTQQNQHICKFVAYTQQNYYICSQILCNNLYICG